LPETALVELLVGFACNNNCKYCSFGTETRNRNRKTCEIKQSILEAAKKKAEIIGFTGGEPTIRRDIIELVEFAEKHGFRTIRIQTNGRMLSNKGFARKIISAGANYFKITVNAHKAKIHDMLSQVPGSFSQTIKGIKNVKSMNRIVEVNILVNKQNYKFLPQTVKFLIGLGISQFTIIYPTYIGNAFKNKEEIAVSLGEAVPFIREALRIAEDYNLDKAVTVNIPPCFLPERASNELNSLKTKVIGPEFSVHLDEKMKKEKVKLPQCKKCKFSNLCPGIRRDYVKVFGAKDVKPVPGKKIASLKDLH